MRISDWSSDVCSSDLGLRPFARSQAIAAPVARRAADRSWRRRTCGRGACVRPVAGRAACANALPADGGDAVADARWERLQPRAFQARIKRSRLQPLPTGIDGDLGAPSGFVAVRATLTSLPLPTMGQSGER